MPEIVNQIRFFSFIAGVLAKQQHEPLCGSCKAFVNTAARVREEIAALHDLHSGELADLPESISGLLREARAGIAALRTPQNAVGQKKAGLCRMPEGVCFVKASKAIRDRI